MAPLENVFKQCLLLIQCSGGQFNLLRNFSSQLRIKSPSMSTWKTAQLEAIERKRLESFIKNKQHMVANQRDKTVVDNKDRLDDLHYESSDFQSRKYNRTWTDFAEQVTQKRKCLVYQQDEVPPARRRTLEERPTTAKPWDNEARQFINQLDVRTPLTPLAKKQAPPVAPPVTKYLKNRFESHVTYDGKPQRYY